MRCGELEAKGLIVSDIDNDRLRAIAEAERLLGKTVYRITTPYRGVPTVTSFIIRNYRTTRNGRKLMYEVCHCSVNVMNLMSIDRFYLTRESAEAALAGKGEP